MILFLKCTVVLLKPICTLDIHVLSSVVSTSEIQCIPVIRHPAETIASHLCSRFMSAIAMSFSRFPRLVSPPVILKSPTRTTRRYHAPRPPRPRAPPTPQPSAPRLLLRLDVRGCEGPVPDAGSAAPNLNPSAPVSTEKRERDF
jgi:hypothetical protein